MLLIWFYEAELWCWIFGRFWFFVFFSLSFFSKFELYSVLITFPAFVQCTRPLQYKSKEEREKEKQNIMVTQIWIVQCSFIHSLSMLSARLFLALRLKLSIIVWSVKREPSCARWVWLLAKHLNVLLPQCVFFRCWCILWHLPHTFIKIYYA